jgi:RNA-binding protein Luc7-like 2
MVDAMRTMLDELMGKERNLPPEERTGKGISYKDALICKYALAGLCPYGLFKNTKSDLGNTPPPLPDKAVPSGL